ncbi:hypothetical protein AQPE_0011 [Aquipluma nitroreducens]|uniref:HNH endonuclease 5 domain-containing protein n=2 Tax=Aquipluma nitroreducens TaxID=2010828 RepID=A0A5K7S349_9BACT|nr:hypothetical protein AQPE_0011 [Aquipluma nitroreducens]
MRCIFCKSESTNSKSVEHVIPESLGSKTIVLPQGLVCDKCNNYFSNKVERPLLTHPSFRNIRAWYQVPNKKGKLPSVKGIIAGEDVDISLKIGKNGKFIIQPEEEKFRNKLEIQIDKAANGEVFSPFIFKLEFDPPKKEMSRFLAKMGLEFLAFRFLKNKDLIEFLIDSDHYDPIRNFAKTGNNSIEWTYSMRKLYPIETKMCHPVTGELVMAGFGYDLLLNHRRESYFIFLYYGFEFAINLGGPSIKGYEEWLEKNDQISPIIERNGAKVVKEIIDGKDTFVIRGDLDLNTGRIFDNKQLKEYFI